MGPWGTVTGHRTIQHLDTGSRILGVNAHSTLCCVHTAGDWNGLSSAPDYGQTVQLQCDRVTGQGWEYYVQMEGCNYAKTAEGLTPGGSTTFEQISFCREAASFGLLLIPQPLHAGSEAVLRVNEA